MRHTLKKILIILLAVLLTATGAGAGGVHFNEIDFGLGSLIANGVLAGLGRTDGIVTLTASGVPLVTCTNQGGNEAPGQNPSRVTATGSTPLSHITYTKNGTTDFTVETSEIPVTSSVALGCSNENWTATIVFVFWDFANITVTNASTGAVLLDQDFTCVTTHNPDSVSCTPVN